jgi:D-alanyl-D-alanine carboxypeptidase/D-alanyl-D-alanine-endopeptidase (penicillin-binding protein 4)
VGVRQTLTELGVRTQGDQWYDGSGLSRQNRLAPRILTDVLRVAASADHPELRAVLSGLPVAGFTGSLEYRFTDAAPPARGHVRAKTGTLRNTAALAGLVTDRVGTTAVFVLMADRVPYLKSLLAESDLDDAAAALAGCRCSVGSGP